MELTIEQAIQRAIEAHKAGKLQEAEALYRAILQKQPKHSDANHNLGVLAVSLNKSSLALPLFKSALEANPKKRQYWISYVDALIKEKNFDSAKNVLEQGKKQGLSGEKVDALEIYLGQLDTTLLSNGPESNRIIKAIELRETGRYQEAQNWLINILTAERNNAEAWSLLSQIYFLDNKYVEAEQALSNASAINTELPSIYRNQARLLLIKSKPEEALLKAQSAYENSTNDSESLLVLAACLGANKRDAEALHIIESALKAKPNYAEAFANRAMIRLRATDIIGAKKDLELAISLKPHLWKLWGLLGSLRYQTNNLTGAIEALEKAHKFEPFNVNYMIDLGEFLRQDSRITEAIKTLEEATRLAPENANAWINLGTAFQQDSKIDDAKLAYEKALLINPKSAEIASNLGAIAKDKGDWILAQKYFEQALEAKPNLAEAHNNLGVIHQALGRLEDAEISYKKALGYKPEDAKEASNTDTTLPELGSVEETKTIDKKETVLKSNYEKAQYNLGILYCEQGKYKLAVEKLTKIIKFKDSESYLLKCWYFLNEQKLFYEQLDSLISQGKLNAIIGSFVSRAEIKYGNSKSNPFCNNPLDYILKADLSENYNFSNIFVKPVLTVLNDKQIGQRPQNLLNNGLQTSGNLFDLENIMIDEIKRIIYSEIEKYRLQLKDNNEGYLKRWPEAYSLNGWIISMKNGGNICPHMHEGGWISGSIYINVPPKININDGNLVVCIEDDSYLNDLKKNRRKIIDVFTGSLCLFPASLLHYTIPFESDQERIVLAFDVVPKTVQ